MTTTDLSKFGFRELEETAQLLTAYINGGVPEDFEEDGVTVMFNQNSGYVFLTNSEFQAAMLDDDGKLYSFYTTPYEGLEGSYEDLMEQYKDMHEEDKEYMDGLKQYHNVQV